MNKNGHWLVVAAATLFVAPSLYLMGELTGASEPHRARGAARNASDGAYESGTRGSVRGSAADSAALADARRRSGSAASADDGSSGARSSRGVYTFAVNGSTSGAAPVVDASYRNGDPSFGRLPGQFFDPRDLAVLEEIIRANRLTEDSSSSDYDDGDGELEPTELGNQVWCGSRLRVLQMGPTQFSSFGYTLNELPPTVANLENLAVLEANGTGLKKLPDTLGQMQSLERVSATGNQLTEIPPELALAGRLEEIQLSSNQIKEIPNELQQKPGLKSLFVAGNPIQEMPRMLVKQNEKLMLGKLKAPMRDLRSFGPGCRTL